MNRKKVLRSPNPRASESLSRITLLATMLGLATIGTGCAATSEIEANEVLNYARCAELTRGISQITFAELSAVRGVRMLRDPAQPAPAETPLPPDAVLVAVFNGRQPTAGYGFEFTDARQSGREIRLNYTWRTPAPDSVQATVVTSPCSVMQLAPMQSGMRVTAWLNEAPLGTVEVSVSAAEPSGDDT